MMSLTGIRILIEFSSILVLLVLCMMHEFVDVTMAKEFSVDHASSQSNFDNVEPTSLHLSAEGEKSFVRFTPESLEFGPQYVTSAMGPARSLTHVWFVCSPISMPVIETVYVHNGHDEINIQMISISGNTEHFHCSFFEDKIVPARSNTSFQVVFLARQEGLVNNTLYIHSSVGSFQYRVSAFGEASPFRVRPLIGARVPLNSSFASLIYIYNPFSTPLQLTEMYTSGGGLHLELPDDEHEAPSSVWKVPPYETRPVMKAHFVARIASNHTSYIRIRTNATDVQLMLPVEVEVSNSPGLYSPLDTLDFGVLRSHHDPPKILPIQVINAAMKFIYVQNIVVTPLSEGLSVDFDGPVKLPPRTSTPYHIANLVLDPNQFSCTGLCIGKVLIKSKNNQYKLSIPFVVRIIQGELHFNNSLSHFFIDESSTSEQRTVAIENRFDTAILVHDIHLADEAKPYFKLTVKSPNTLPVLLPVGQPFPLLDIEFSPSHQISHFSTYFRLLTNFSYFDMDLHAYRGRLDLFIPNSSDQTKLDLDLGLVGLSEQKSSTFVVSNHNPIPVRLIYWHCDLTGVTVEFVGTSQGNITSVNHRMESSSFSRSEATSLQPNHFAVFRVHVNKLSKEGSYRGNVSVTTPFETLSVPLRFSVLRGSLISTKVILPKTFPGRTVSAFLNVKSNYTSQIKLKGAFVEPKDERFQIKLSESFLRPGEDNQIQIMFDASAACPNKVCYSALDIEREVGHLWLLGGGQYSDTAYIDKELYKLIRNQWLLMTESDRNPAVNIRLQVDGFGSFITEAQAQLYWPRISNKLAIRFPSTRIGRSITKELMIENPADRPVLVQALNVASYHNSEVLFSLLSNGMFHQQWSRMDLDLIEATMRSGQNNSAFLLTNSSSASNPNQISDWLGVTPTTNSYAVFLPPGARQRLTISFHPLEEKNFTSLLILRNNLTIIEAVMLRGEGGRGLLKIGKTLPNTSNSKLILEFPEKSLEKKCRNREPRSELSKAPPPPPTSSLTIKERLKVTNIGRMGLQIRSFLIDGNPCEGHGFHIQHCEPAFLMPNQSLDIEMLYTPDFTQSIVAHDLVILVDDDLAQPQKFQLVVNVPQKLLLNCLSALPRPTWENFIYYLLILMAVFVLLLSIVVAISDAHRITSSAILLEVEDDLRDEQHLSNGTNHSTEGSKKLNTSNESGLSGKQLPHGQASGLGKVRNRRGNKSNNNINNANNNNPNRHLSSKSSVNSSAIGQNGLKPESAFKEDESQDKNRTPPLNVEFSDSPNWSNVMRKKLLRQDSSSSEHSQRSSDNSSQNNSSYSRHVESDLSNRYKKQQFDSSNETLPQSTSLINQSSSVESKSSKYKEQDLKSVEAASKATNLKKNNKSVKQSRQISNDKAQKPFEKNQSVDATKSSTESLNFASKLDSEIPTKTRSATLPLLNESKSALLNDNISISQSDIVTNNDYDNGAIGKPNNKSPLKLSKANFERYDNNVYNNAYRNYRTEFPKLNSNAIPEANYYDGRPMERPPKDIWDLPITNFDSELAMNILVKQTEEFAAHDDKLLHARSVETQKFPIERNGNSASKFNTWEIGEWNNEYAKDNSNNNNYHSREFGAQAKYNRHMFGNEDRVGQFGNSFSKDSFERGNEPNHNYRPSNSFKHSLPIGHARSTAPSINNSSLVPNTSSTFSPVIGRPTPANSSTAATNTSQAHRLINYNNAHSNFNEFNLNSTFDSAFTLKPNLLDLDLNFLSQSQYPPTASSQQTMLPENKQNLNSLFASSEWNPNPLDNFGSGAFATSTDTMPKASTSPSLFNFEAKSVWETSSAAWSYPSSAIDCKQSSSSTSFPAPVADSKSACSSKWPSTPSSASSSAFVSSVASNSDSHFYPAAKLSPSPTSANNRVWSPFDSYCNPTPTCLTSSGQSQSKGTSESSLFDGGSSVFELFAGKSPWAPLDSSSCPSKNTSSASPSMDPFSERFPPNPSPTSSSSSTNQSSSTSS